MKHPWITRRGSWPLRSVKEMVRQGDTPELPPVLPDLMSTLNVLDIPRQVCIAFLLLRLHLISIKVLISIKASWTNPDRCLPAAFPCAVTPVAVVFAAASNS